MFKTELDYGSGRKLRGGEKDKDIYRPKALRKEKDWKTLKLRRGTSGVLCGASFEVTLTRAGHKATSEAACFHRTAQGSGPTTGCRQRRRVSGGSLLQPNLEGERRDAPTAKHP